MCQYYGYHAAASTDALFNYTKISYFEMFVRKNLQLFLNYNGFPNNFTVNSNFCIYFQKYQMRAID